MLLMGVSPKFALDSETKDQLARIRAPEILTGHAPLARKAAICVLVV